MMTLQCGYVKLMNNTKIMPRWSKLTEETCNIYFSVLNVATMSSNSIVAGRAKAINFI